MPTYTYDQVLKSDAKKEYIVKPILTVGGTLLMSAPEKSMKTFLGLQLGLAIAGGEDFIGLPSDVAGKRVLYIDQEIGLAETKARMVYMAQVFNNDKVKVNFKIHTDNEIALSLDKQWKRGPEYSEEVPSQGLLALMQVLGDHQPEVVIIDPLRDSHSSEENSPTEMSKVMKTLRFLKNKYKFTLVLFHHMGRPKDDPRHAPQGRGTNAVDAAATTIGTITKTDAMNGHGVTLKTH
jgi:RecA-family ATPase